MQLSTLLHCMSFQLQIKLSKLLYGRPRECDNKKRSLSQHQEEGETPPNRVHIITSKQWQKNNSLFPNGGKAYMYIGQKFYPNSGNCFKFSGNMKHVEIFNE